MQSTATPLLFSPDRLRTEFDAGLPFDAYIATGTDHQARSWQGVHDQATLAPAQAHLITGFVREINILAISGVWCGDCAQQLPFLERFRAANPDRVRVRYIDRDARADFTGGITICSGHRVPAVVFMNEDYDFVSLFGDRTLSRYRSLAARHLGASCPIPGAAVPQDELNATQQDWLDELERVHLLCRLSPKLRGRHGD